MKIILVSKRCCKLSETIVERRVSCVFVCELHSTQLLVTNQDKTIKQTLRIIADNSKTQLTTRVVNIFQTGYIAGKNLYMEFHKLFGVLQGDGMIGGM
jgi:hypothetical protein